MPAARKSAPGKNIAKAPKRQGRPTFAESVELRETIAQCALAAFMRDGFKAASIEAIARSANVTKLTIYRHFLNKENLFIEAALLGMKKLNLGLDAAINYREDPATILRKVVRKIYQVQSDPDVAAVTRMAIFEGGNDPDKAAQEFRNASITLAPLIEYLRWLSETQGFSIEDPKKAALQVSALATDGLRIFFEKPYKTRAQIERHAESVVTLLMNGWGPPRGQSLPITDSKRNGRQEKT